MPANVGPEYKAAEAKLREATTPGEQLAALQEMLRTIPKHKGTDKMQADIKRRIARIRKEVARAGKSGGSKPFYHVDRADGGQTVLVGPPNSGKSSLLAALSNAAPEVAEYPYTTRLPMPGMMQFENTQVQLVDLPPVAAEGCEPWLFEIVKHASLALLVVDANSDDVLSEIDETVAALRERHVELVSVDAADQGEAVRAILVATKVDTDHAEDDYQILSELAGDWLPMISVSAVTGRNLERLRGMVFDGLRLIRIYTKAPGRDADLTAPFLLPRGATVVDAARAVHGDFVDDLKYARIWGKGHFDGQMVGRDDVLRDEDLIEFHA